LLVGHHRPGFYMRVITEGHIQAGDKVIKTRAGRYQLSVADIDALLYLPERNPAKLRLAVQIPALSPGWQQSFRNLLAEGAGPTSTPSSSGQAAWRGFRQLRVASVSRETPSVVSITLSAPDAAALSAALPGQYLTLRLPQAGDPPPIRNYSLSGDPNS